ncbi:MAG: hypothetical protein ABI091_24650 [Ferruginibacter sp.]
MENSKMLELKNLYFDKSKEAIKGKEILDQLLNAGDKKALAYLLRDHNQETISDEETWERDYVDFFLNYYSIVSLAFTLGYIDDDDDKLNFLGEMGRYFSNPSILKYAFVYYPLMLPQALLLSRISNKLFVQENQEDDIDNLFFQFHQLNQTVDNDDVYQFLWFLDGGSNDEFDIDDLNDILKDGGKYLRVISGKDNALKEAILGFFDYLVFTEKLYDFLDGISNKAIQSAFWHYHGYWIEKISVRLSDAIKLFCDGFSKIRFNERDPEYMMKRIELEQGIESFRDKHNLILEKLFDPSLKAPLLVYINGILQEQSNLLTTFSAMNKYLKVDKKYI